MLDYTKIGIAAQDFLRLFVEKGLEVSPFEGRGFRATTGEEYATLRLEGTSIPDLLIRFVEEISLLKAGKTWIEWRITPSIEAGSENVPFAYSNNTRIYMRFLMK